MGFRRKLTLTYHYGHYCTYFHTIEKLKGLSSAGQRCIEIHWIQR